MHLALMVLFPLSVDELHLWNLYNQYDSFGELWKHFLAHETHLPLFYLITHPLFDAQAPEWFLRLPSFFFYLFSLFFFKKLFPSNALIPWALYLLTPFLALYQVLFLPYSLLALLSLAHFLSFESYRKHKTMKQLGLYFLCSFLLASTHYFGLLQVLLLFAWLLWAESDRALKKWAGLIATLAFLALTLYSNFFQNFFVSHQYRHPPGPLELIGHFNLLLGGFFFLGVFGLFALKKRKVWQASWPSFFIIAVMGIALVRSYLIAPSLEARYLIILLYPLYRIAEESLPSKFVWVFLLTLPLTTYRLLTGFGPGFVIPYNKVLPGPIATPVGVLITPCPKYYLSDEQYICKDYTMERAELAAQVEHFLVHQDHLAFFESKFPERQCRALSYGLFLCELAL